MMTNLLFSQFTAIGKRLAMVLTMLLVVGIGQAWGAETIIYTLDGTATGGSNGYAEASSITQNNVSWSVVGNTTTNPWRIGGKSLTNTDRTIASTTPIASNISKVVVSHGTANSVTVNSLKLIVASDASFSNVVSTVTGEFTASTTTTFTCPNNADWTNMYYKFVYKITISSTSNKYLQFNSATFYGEESQTGGGSTTVDPEVTFSDGEYTIGGVDLDLSTLWESESTGAVTYSVTNANGTGATCTAAGSFSATTAGTCTVQASQAETASHNAITKTATITVTAPAGGGGSDDCDNPTWQLVTNVSDLAVGDEIVIAASGEDYALSTTQNSNNRSATAITKSNNTITFSEAVQIITLVQGSTTGTLSFLAGDGYLYAASSSKNYMRTSRTPGSDGDWVIGIDNTGVATIQAQGDNTNSVIRYNPNSGTPIFSCYASSSTTGSLPSIYKKVCTAETTHYLLRK